MGSPHSPHVRGIPENRNDSLSVLFWATKLDDAPSSLGNSGSGSGFGTSSSSSFSSFPSRPPSSSSSSPAASAPISLGKEQPLLRSGSGSGVGSSSSPTLFLPSCPLLPKLSLNDSSGTSSLNNSAGGGGGGGHRFGSQVDFPSATSPSRSDAPLLTLPSIRLLIPPDALHLSPSSPERTLASSSSPRLIGSGGGGSSSSSSSIYLSLPLSARSSAPNSPPHIPRTLSHGLPTTTGGLGAFGGLSGAVHYASSTTPSSSSSPYSPSSSASTASSASAYTSISFPTSPLLSARQLTTGDEPLSPLSDSSSPVLASVNTEFPQRSYSAPVVSFRPFRSRRSPPSLDFEQAIGFSATPYSGGGGGGGSGGGGSSSSSEDPLLCWTDLQRPCRVHCTQRVRPASLTASDAIRTLYRSMYLIRKKKPANSRAVKRISTKELVRRLYDAGCSCTQLQFKKNGSAKVSRMVNAALEEDVKDVQKV